MEINGKTNNDNIDDIYDEEFEDFLVDYKDTFDPWDVENYLKEHEEFQEDISNDNLEYSNETINLKPASSDLNGEQKNQTIKKMQFYISIVVGAVLMIFILLNIISNMFTQKKEEKIVEVEAPRVVKLDKDKLFVKAIDQREYNSKQSTKENIKHSSKEDSKNPFIALNKEDSKNPFSSTINILKYYKCTIKSTNCKR